MIYTVYVSGEKLTIIDTYVFSPHFMDSLNIFNEIYTHNQRLEIFEYGCLFNKHIPYSKIILLWAQVQNI